MESKTKNSTHPVDKFVGVKLRQKRIISGLSQDDLGKALGLTFQQIQKYESGLNRISCSKLYELSVYLDVPISFFFEGFSPEVDQDSVKSSYLLSENDDAFNYLIEEKEIINLIKYYSCIANDKIRKRLMGLIKTLSPLEYEEEV